MSTPIILSTKYDFQLCNVKNKLAVEMIGAETLITVDSNILLTTRGMVPDLVTALQYPVEERLEYVLRTLENEGESTRACASRTLSAARDNTAETLVDNFLHIPNKTSRNRKRRDDREDRNIPIPKTEILKFAITLSAEDKVTTADMYFNTNPKINHQEIIRSTLDILAVNIQYLNGYHPLSPIADAACSAMMRSMMSLYIVESDVSELTSMITSTLLNTMGGLENLEEFIAMLTDTVDNLLDDDQTVEELRQLTDQFGTLSVLACSTRSVTYSLLAALLVVAK